MHSIALLGPLADSKLDTLGSWAIHGDRRDTVTIADGLREALPNTRVDVTTGVEIARGSSTIFDSQVPPEPLHLTTDAARQAEFDHALALARAADVAVLVLGEAQTMNGENASRASLSLPGDQERLLEAVTALGKPTVLIVMTGRPLDITWASTHVPAILNVWYPGTEGGHAAARLLLGDVNPSGHLPVSWPRNVGQEPLFYNHNIPQNPENVAHRYWDLPSTPLYPFWLRTELRGLRPERPFRSANQHGCRRNVAGFRAAQEHVGRGRHAGGSDLYAPTRGQRVTSGARAESLPQGNSRRGRYPDGADRDPAQRALFLEPSPAQTRARTGRVRCVGRYGLKRNVAHHV